MTSSAATGTATVQCGAPTGTARHFHVTAADSAAPATGQAIRYPETAYRIG